MSTSRLPAAVEQALEEHAFSEVRTEVGGLLVGTLDDDGATVTAALPALSAQAGQMHVTFTHDVWERALTVLDRDHAGQRIVGWYHTHPGFGLFLSEYDRFVHQEFFSDPRMLALVVDPIAGERGWFQSTGDGLELVTQEPTTRPAQARTAPADVRSRSTARVPALLAVPALLLAGAIGGYALAGTAADTAPTPAVAMASDSSGTAQKTPDPELTAAQGEVAELRRQVTQLQTRQAAPTRPSGFRYEVRRGDSLSELSQSVFGALDQWPVIAAANPGIDPDRLEVGQVVCVPLPQTGPAPEEAEEPTCP